MLKALVLLGLADMQLRSATRLQAREPEMPAAAGPSTPRAKPYGKSLWAPLVSPYFGSSSTQPTPARKASGKAKAVRGSAVDVPPTPDSLPRKKSRRKEAVVELDLKEGNRPKRRRTKQRLAEVEVEVGLGTPSKGKKRSKDSKEKGALHGEITQGGREQGKIHLIQERVRHDPWKILVATCLLNKTSGRAAVPVFWQILERWPTAEALSQAAIPDLSELLYPLGLFNQRAASLVRMSQQYLSLGWPLPSGGTPASLGGMDTDIKVFYGAGVYASDSFRIYSDLLPGGGAPCREEHWEAKRARAVERQKNALGDEEGWAEYLSDEDVEDGGDEWRKVVPLDKELRRYLIWRWGLEGIEYDILKGPKIVRESDKRRLGLLL